MIGQRLPEVVNPISLAGSHDVVIHRPDFRARFAIFDQLYGRHTASAFAGALERWLLVLQFSRISVSFLFGERAKPPFIFFAGNSHGGEIVAQEGASNGLFEFIEKCFGTRGRELFSHRVDFASAARNSRFASASCHGSFNL